MYLIATTGDKLTGCSIGSRSCQSGCVAIETHGAGVSSSEDDIKTLSGKCTGVPHTTSCSRHDRKKLLFAETMYVLYCAYLSSSSSLRLPLKLTRTVSIKAARRSTGLGVYGGQAQRPKDQHAMMQHIAVQCSYGSSLTLVNFLLSLSDRGITCSYKVSAWKSHPKTDVRSKSLTVRCVAYSFCCSWLVRHCGIPKHAIVMVCVEQSLRTYLRQTRGPLQQGNRSVSLFPCVGQRGSQDLSRKDG